MKLTFHRFIPYPHAWSEGHIHIGENEAVIALHFRSQRTVGFVRWLAHMIRGEKYRPNKKLSDQIAGENQVPVAHLSEEETQRWVDANHAINCGQPDLVNINGLVFLRGIDGRLTFMRDDSQIQIAPNAKA